MIAGLPGSVGGRANLCPSPNQDHEIRLSLDRGHEKLPTGGHLIPHPSGLVVTVRRFCAVDRREDAYEEREDSGGADRVV